MLKFSGEKLQEALTHADIRVISIDHEAVPGTVYIHFEDSNLKWIRAASAYDGKNNCINIYHGPMGGTKNGYWWDGPLDYKQLAEELMRYHAAPAKP